MLVGAALAAAGVIMQGFFATQWLTLDYSASVAVLLNGRRCYCAALLLPRGAGALEQMVFAIAGSLVVCTIIFLIRSAIAMAA